MAVIEDALMQQSYRRSGPTTEAVDRRDSAEMKLLEPYLGQWDLEGDGEPILTATSRLLPVTLPERFEQRLALVTEQSGIERRRLLHWIVAWCGLSAAWFIEDGLSPEIDFRITELAIAELDR